MTQKLKYIDLRDRLYHIINKYSYRTGYLIIFRLFVNVRDSPRSSPEAFEVRRDVILTHRFPSVHAWTFYAFLHKNEGVPRDDCPLYLKNLVNLELSIHQR